MCESTFPEVDKCCGCCTLRVGCLFIAVLSIMTGGCILSVLEYEGDTCFTHSKKMYQAYRIVEEREDYAFFYKYILDFSVLGLSIHAAVLVVAGASLLFADLTDQEGFAQLFVWLTFFNNLFGMLMLIGVGIECVGKTDCIMGFDWLEASYFIMWSTAFYGLLYYGAVVANSYSLNGDTNALRESEYEESVDK